MVAHDHSTMILSEHAMPKSEAVASLSPSGALLTVDGRILIGQGPEQRCRAMFISADDEPIITGAVGRAEEAAVCYLDNIGMLPGTVGAIFEAGFIMRLDLPQARRDRVAARVAWQGHWGGASVEQREGTRIVPRHRDVMIRLPDGRQHAGLIEDLSKSGAAITSDPSLTVEIGTVVVIGKRYAEVVRRDPDAIAVRFRLPFTDETFHPDIVL